LTSKLVATVFYGLVSKPAATASSGLASKPAAMVFSGLASKPVTTVFSSLASKLVATVSSGLVSKPTVGFLVEPQNQVGGGFLDLSLKTGSFGLVIFPQNHCSIFLVCASKSSELRFVGYATKPMEGGRRDTHRDITTCFTYKQVWLWFFSLA
jgi:hypothetical protein